MGGGQAARHLFHARCAGFEVKPPRVFIALGANLGDPAAQIRQALQDLKASSVGPFRASSLWSSTPDDCPPGSPRFVNAVAEWTPAPSETPENVLLFLQRLERIYGRTRKQEHNEARLIDLDLITWGNEIRATPDLTLPHPRAHQRRFVLAPLVEIAPNLVLPGQVFPVRILLDLAPEDPALHRIS